MIAAPVWFALVGALLVLVLLLALALFVVVRIARGDRAAIDAELRRLDSNERVFADSLNTIRAELTATSQKVGSLRTAWKLRHGGTGLED